MINDYIPEVWSVKKDVIYAAITAVENGLAYARECLIHHEAALGRTTFSNKRLADMMEQDIKQLEDTLKILQACGIKVNKVDSLELTNDVKKTVADDTDVEQISKWCEHKDRLGQCTSTIREDGLPSYPVCRNEVCPMRKPG